MRRKRSLIGCCLGMLIPAMVYAASPYDAVEHGNTLYQQGQYKQAQEQYTRAAEQLPESAAIHFNLGNAAFKQHDYATALQHYTDALQGADPALESQVKYNLGNVRHHQALQSLADPQKAAEHLRSAMTYYRDSLEANPHQPHARYNLQLAHRLLQQLQPPPRHNQSQQARQQQQQNQQQQQQQAQQQQQQQAQQQQQPQTAASESPSDQSEPPQDRSVSREMTPEEAKRMLEVIREHAREADNLRQQRRRARMRALRVDKDW